MCGFVLPVLCFPCFCLFVFPVRSFFASPKIQVGFLLLHLRARPWASSRKRLPSFLSQCCCGWSHLCVSSTACSLNHYFSKHITVIKQTKVSADSEVFSHLWKMSAVIFHTLMIEKAENSQRKKKCCCRKYLEREQRRATFDRLDISAYSCSGNSIH